MREDGAQYVVIDWAIQHRLGPRSLTINSKMAAGITPIKQEVRIQNMCHSHVVAHDVYAEYWYPNDEVFEVQTECEIRSLSHRSKRKLDSIRCIR